MTPGFAISEQVCLWDVVLSFKMYVSGERGSSSGCAFFNSCTAKVVCGTSGQLFFPAFFAARCVLGYHHNFADNNRQELDFMLGGFSCMASNNAKNSVRLSSVSNDLIDVRDAKCSIERRTRTGFVV